MIRVIVNERTCEHHGQCEIVCPEVFELVDGARALRYVAEPDASLRAELEEAADACPTQPIRIEDRG